MKKLIKILLTVSMLFTCFGVNVFADSLGNVTFTSDGNETDNVISNFVEYDDVTIESGAEVKITSSGVLVVGGNYTNSGQLTAETGAHLVFNDISNAKNKIEFYDHWENPFGEDPNGFMELEYDDNEKWIQFFASPVFESANNDTDDNKVNGFTEYIDVAIGSGAVVILEGDSTMVIHGTFANSGSINATQGAHIIFDDGTQAVGKLDIYDSEGNEFAETPAGFRDFEYDGSIWKEVIPLVDEIFGTVYFDASMSNPDHILYEWNEYNDVTVESNVYVKLADKNIDGENIHCVMYIHGDYKGSGKIFGDADAHLIFDNVENAFGSEEMGSRLYDSSGNSFTETPNGYMEFEYKDDKWVEFIPPKDIAIEYDDEQGEVYHYEGDTLTYLQQDWKDDGEGPYRNCFYQMDGEDTYYIKAKDGYVFDHIEAEGDDPESAEYPGNRIINEETQPDENIGGVDYKVVKVTTNPKDDNFYFFQFIFVDDPGVVNQRLAEKLNTLELAFASSVGEDKLKEYIAHSIYSRYLEQGTRYRVENTTFEEDDFETFKGKVQIVEEGTPTKTPVQIDGTDSNYYKYKIDGLDNFIGIVYKLSDTDQFILRDGNTYTTIDVSEDSQLASEGEGAAVLKDFKAVQGAKIVVKTVNNTVNKEESENVPNYEIFGNYAGFPMNYTGRMQDSQDTNYISIEQVMPCAPNGIDASAFNGLGCEMILYSKNFLGVSVKSDKNAKPWSQDNLPIYPTNSGNEEATVFYASDSAIIASAYGAPAASAIKNVTFNNGSKSWNDCSIAGDEGGPFTVSFGSIFYDKVPLKITYTNGTSKSFVIARTGISIGDYPAPGGEDSVDVSGVTVNFTDDNKWLIAAPFYYDSSSPDRVKLFVKITDNNGSVSTKIVDPINGSIKDDGSGDTYNKYDVFELWRGKGDTRPQKIEVIAFVNGDTDSFGGVKLGSGSGIKWTQERGRQ